MEEDHSRIIYLHDINTFHSRILFVSFYHSDTQSIFGYLSSEFFIDKSITILIVCNLDEPALKRIRHYHENLPPSIAKHVNVHSQTPPSIACRFLKTQFLNLNSIFSELIAYRTAYSTLKRFNPTVLFLSSDWLGLSSKYFLRHAKALQIKSCLLLRYIKTGPDPANALSVLPSHHVKNQLELFLWKLFFPSYLYSYHNFNLLRTTRSRFLLNLILGVHDKSPWIAYTDQADYFLHDSPFYQFVYQKYYHSTSKYICITPPHSLPPSTNRDSTILVSLPYDMDGISLFSPDNDQFHKLLQNLIQTYQASIPPSFTVNYTMHPNTPAKVIAELQSLFDIYIASQKYSTYDLLTQSCLYVTNASTTILWALDLGLDIIDYDYAQLGVSEFLPYVLSVNSIDELRYALSSYVRSDMQLNDIFQAKYRQYRDDTSSLTCWTNNF